MTRDPFARFRTEQAGKRGTSRGRASPPGTQEPVDQDTARRLAVTKARLQEIDREAKVAAEFAEDGAFFTCVVFPTAKHLDAFLEAVKAVSFWEDDPQYIDGMELAKRLGIAMPPMPTARKPRLGYSWRGVPILKGGGA